MSDVFDLDAFAAEATSEPFRFRFGGDEFELPGTVDLRVASKLQGGKVVESLQVLIGPEQWARLEGLPGVFDYRAARELFIQYGKHLGIDLGESVASSNSSSSTARRSRPTSNASTKSTSGRSAKTSRGGASRR